MRERIEVIDENLRIYPVMVEPQQGKTLVLGDLHGNAMKLIYLLLRYGIINIGEEQFYRLWMLYDSPVSRLSLDDIVEFKTIVNDAAVGERPDLLVILGDEFADRGQNDFFTALVFKKLHDSNVPYKINLSNHGARLLACIEGVPYAYCRFRGGQECSLENLTKLLSKFESLIDEFKALLEHAYKDHLVLIGYIQEENKPLCILTHAPIDNVIMTDLAKRLDIAYDSETGEHIVECIDQINTFILTSLISNTFTVEFSSVVGSDVCKVISNRELPQALLPAGIVNVHGHIGVNGCSFPKERYINLDSNWGKPAEMVSGLFGNKCLLPADDSSPCPIFLTLTSPADRNSDYYRTATRDFFDQIAFLEEEELMMMDAGNSTEVAASSVAVVDDSLIATPSPANQQRP